ncbi:LacI family DNA-binding transcriptional regulator [Actinomadura flavalba]|uniref:LacI family DNA-binding transcriptional regulator n=1 Tax=Actinomadura flavalba TaxID=1120938 RepID=UPI000477E31F|nr:LacI family DNA-binding transcriptional regulator [Actinomadura flavalba]
MPQTSIREVARRAGVSVGTVSNVLNRPEMVAEATRDRVRAAIEELGFVRNESARRLRQGPAPDDADRRARAFGVLVEDLANPYASDVARGAELAFEEAGYETLWISTGYSPERERRALEFLVEQRATGALVNPVGLGPDSLAALRESGMSVVLLDRAGTDACSAQVDHVAGGDIAAARLLSLGRDRLAFVTGRPEPQPIVERAEGAARTLAKAGGEPLVTLTQDALSPTEGQAAARRLLELDPMPTGVFCANDLLAIGLVNELVKRGVRVPEDIAVIGYDDIELAGSAAVPLTTIRQPRRELGWEAAELALAEYAEGASHEHRQVVLAPELVVRETG